MRSTFPTGVVTSNGFVESSGVPRAFLCIRALQRGVFVLAVADSCEFNAPLRDALRVEVAGNSTVCDSPVTCWVCDNAVTMFVLWLLCLIVTALLVVAVVCRAPFAKWRISKASAKPGSFRLIRVGQRLDDTLLSDYSRKVAATLVDMGCFRTDSEREPLLTVSSETTTPIFCLRSPSRPERAEDVRRSLRSHRGFAERHAVVLVLDNKSDDPGRAYARAIDENCFVVAQDDINPRCTEFQRLADVIRRRENESTAFNNYSNGDASNR